MTLLSCSTRYFCEYKINQICPFNPNILKFPTKILYRTFSNFQRSLLKWKSESIAITKFSLPLKKSCGIFVFVLLRKNVLITREEGSVLWHSVSFEFIDVWLRQPLSFNLSNRFMNQFHHFTVMVLLCLAAIHKSEMHRTKKKEYIKSISHLQMYPSRQSHDHISPIVLYKWTLHPSKTPNPHDDGHRYLVQLYTYATQTVNDNKKHRITQTAREESPLHPHWPIHRAQSCCVLHGWTTTNERKCFLGTTKVSTREVSLGHRLRCDGCGFAGLSGRRWMGHPLRRKRLTYILRGVRVKVERDWGSEFPPLFLGRRT